MSVYMTMSVDNLVDVLSVYTAHRLATEPATAAILERWNPDVERLDLAGKALEEAIREQLRTRAQRDWEELKVRNSLRSFANRTAELGNGSRRTAIFQTYFPNGFTALSRLSLDDLIPACRLILTRLETETDADLRAGGERLAASVTAAEPIVAAHQAALADVATKRATLHAARVAWVGAYRRIEGELTALYPQDRALVRSFFYRRRVNRKKDPTESGNGIPTEEQVTVGAA